MEREPIIALDFATWEETDQFLALFPGESLFVKVWSGVVVCEVSAVSS